MGSQIMSDFTFAEDAAAIQQVLVDDDAALRTAGYPQQLLIALRAAGQTTADILLLPVPVPSPNGEITDDYWRGLRRQGVPNSALPSHMVDSRPPTRHELDLETYASLAAGYTNTGTRPTSAAATFRARFGSPIRPMPPLGGGSSAATGLGAPHTPNSAATPSTVSGSRPTPSTPFGSQLPTAPAGTGYIKHIDIAVSPEEWATTRNDLLSSGTCMVFQCFNMDDKQFQRLVTSIKIPPSIRDVGQESFNPDAWRDMTVFGPDDRAIRRGGEGPKHPLQMH